MSHFRTILVTFLFVAACGRSSDPGPARPSQSSGSCDELAAAAKRDVTSVLDQHVSCSTDADCTGIGVSASCFDSCTRGVNASAAASMDEVRARVDAGACKTFLAQGCKRIVPPCAPPLPPVCAEGRCR